MNLRPKYTTPPELILFQAPPPIPVAAAVVTWSFLYEYKIVVKYKENVISYFPLDLSEVMSGSCRDNAVGMRTGPGRMDNIRAD